MPTISPLFEVHLLNDAGKENAKLIAESFDGFLLYLSKLCPEGREFSIVKTKLEEASFFCKKAMASLPENQWASGTGIPRRGPRVGTERD